MSDQESVEVWIADLRKGGADLHEVLSGEELERVSHLRDERVRALWSASRAILRMLLSRRTGLSAKELVFELAPPGKPRLSGAQVGTSRISGAQVGASRISGAQVGALRFSLSHSGPLAVYAFADGREVGIDIEASGRRRASRRNDVAIARRVLGPEVAGSLETLPPPQRSAAFLRAWVAQEAAVKCLGTGLGGTLQDRDLARSAIWVTELPAVDGAFAALAVEGGPIEVSYRRWEG